MKVEVRRATLTDIPWLLIQIAAFEKFAGFKRKLMADKAHARRVLAGMISNHVVLIAHKGRERQGFIAGFDQPHPFNPDIRVLTEAFWWVDERSRGSRAGAMLLMEFEILGRAVADWIIFSLEHHSPVHETHFTKRGFRLVEKAYLLEVA